MAKKRKKFRRAIDAQEQFDQIEKEQRRYWKGDSDKQIDSIQKTNRRDKNACKRLRRPEDLPEEYDLDE